MAAKAMVKVKVTTAQGRGTRVAVAGSAPRRLSLSSIRAGGARARFSPGVVVFAAVERDSEREQDKGVSATSTPQLKVTREDLSTAALKEAERLLEEADTSKPEQLAEQLASATKRLRRVHKSKTRSFYPSSKAVQDAWTACLYSVDEMDVYSLDKVLQALAYSSSIRCLPDISLQILERVEDALARGDVMLRSPPNVVTTILGSFSRLNHSMSMELQEQFGQYLATRTGQFDVNDLVRTLSFLNKVPRFGGLKNRTLALCSTHIAKNVADLTANQISECMVAFAFSSFYPVANELKSMEDQFTESFFADLLQRGGKSTYDTRALMRLLKSYAKLRIQLPVFIVEGLSNLFSTSDPSDILKPKEAANLIWYFAKMNQYPGSVLLDAACECLLRFFGSDSHGQGGSNYVHVQHMSRISWGLAKLRHKPPEGMMKQLDAFAAKHVKKLTDSEVTQLIYGHALLDEQMCPKSLQSFCKYLMSKCKEVEGEEEELLSLRNLSVLLWSLTVLKVWEDGMGEELDSFWSVLGEQEGDLGYLNVRGKHALHVAASCGSKETDNELSKIPEQFRNGTFEGLEAIAREGGNASEIQREISQVLEKIMDDVQWRFSEDEGRSKELLTADFCIERGADSLPLCIEVDGPSHFFNNTLGQTGKTLFRNRVHSSNGWEVVCLPHFEWEQLQDDQEKEAYLKDLLKV